MLKAGQQEVGPENSIARQEIESSYQKSSQLTRSHFLSRSQTTTTPLKSLHSWSWKLFLSKRKDVIGMSVFVTESMRKVPERGYTQWKSKQFDEITL